RARVLAMFVLESFLVSAGAAVAGGAGGLLLCGALNAAHLHAPAALALFLMAEGLHPLGRPSGVLWGLGLDLGPAHLHSPFPSLPARANAAGDRHAPGGLTMRREPALPTSRWQSARRRVARWVFLLASTAALAARAKPLTDGELGEVIHTIDDRQRNSGDYRSLAYLETKEKDKTDT